MNTKYPEEFKSSVIAKLLPPHNVSIPDMVRETGIPRDTLYTWRNKYRRINGGQAETRQGKPLLTLSNEEKLEVLIETASLSEIELSEYCRRKGFYKEQIAGWKSALAQGLSNAISKSEREQQRGQATTIKKLERELIRKEKALAEAAALLVLQKKFQALWEEPAAERLTSRSARN